MGKDLWSFKSVKDLEKQTKDLPDTILKEQIMLLGEKRILHCMEKLFSLKWIKKKLIMVLRRCSMW